MNRLVRWIAHHPIQLLVLVGMLTVAALLHWVDPHTGKSLVAIDSSVENLLPADSADRTMLQKVRKLFGDEDPVIVAVEFPGGILVPANLQKIADLQKRFAQIDGISAVASLATAPAMRSRDDDLDVDSFTNLAARDPAAISEFAGMIDANPIYRHALISVDGKATAFALMLTDTRPEQWTQGHYDKQIRDVVKILAPDAKVWITGTQVIRAATALALRNTLRYTVPAVFVLIAVMLMIIFRSVRLTVAAMITVAVALIWTTGTAVALHLPLNLISAIVPPLIITIGLSYTIHLLTAFLAAQKQGKLVTRQARIEWVIRRIAPGLALSAGTTIAGFLALNFNLLPAIREFALLASLGTAYVGLLTLCFLPVFAQMMGTAPFRDLRSDKFFARAAEWLADFDTRHRRQIVMTSILLLPVGLWLASGIRTGTDFIQSFDRNAPVRVDFEQINDRFDGANSITILLTAPVDDGLGQAEVVQALRELEQWLRQQPEVGGVFSYVDLLEIIQHGLSTPTSPVEFPNSPAAVKQFLTLGAGDQAQKMVDTNLRNALLTVRIKVDGSLAVGELLNRMDSHLQSLPEVVRAHPTGATVLATRAVNAIATGHLQSIAIAALTIWGLLSVMFMSPRAAAIATLPNLIPVGVYFGTLGLFHISLNPTTSLIACIVLGIAVNDTVHFLARFNADARELGDEAAALRSAMVAVLRPITLATVALCLGFLVFTGSELHNQAQFGALAAFTLAMAWLADMTLTPALGSNLHIVTLWDLLRLDLGQSPQFTIPLLSGLSTRQARMFALVSRLEKVPAGTRLIQEGDYARDIYVIIDGTAEASVDRNGTRKLLSTMTRGSTIGETGYFGQRRTASVDAVTPVRLLRFNSQDMERLRLRYPRIAATVLRNLNLVQAERIARMTAMMK